jgi:hypothetical protein
MASAPISRDARLALKELVESKMDWINIKHLIRKDRVSLATMLSRGNEANIDESMRLTYDSVYYAMKNAFKETAMLDKDLGTSLRKWKDQITASGGQCYTRNLDAMQEGMFMFAFCTQWQMEVSIETVNSTLL